MSHAPTGYTAGMDISLFLLIAAFILFLVAAVWAWRQHRQLAIVSVGLACWVLATFIGSINA